MPNTQTGAQVDPELQAMYAEARRRGMFKRDPEFAEIAQEAVKRGILHDLSGGSVYPSVNERTSAPVASVAPPPPVVLTPDTLGGTTLTPGLAGLATAPDVNAGLRAVNVPTPRAATKPKPTPAKQAKATKAAGVAGDAPSGNLADIRRADDTGKRIADWREATEFNERRPRVQLTEPPSGHLMGGELLRRVSSAPKNFVQGAIAPGIRRYNARVDSGQQPASTSALQNAGSLLSQLGFDVKQGGLAALFGNGDQQIGQVAPSLAPDTVPGFLYNALTGAGLDPLNFLLPGEALRAPVRLPAAVVRAAERTGVTRLARRAAQLTDNLPGKARQAGQVLRTRAAEAQGRVPILDADGKLMGYAKGGARKTPTPRPAAPESPKSSVPAEAPIPTPPAARAQTPDASPVGTPALYDRLQAAGLLPPQPSLLRKGRPMPGGVPEPVAGPAIPLPVRGPRALLPASPVETPPVETPPAVSSEVAQPQPQPPTTPTVNYREGKYWYRPILRPTGDTTTPEVVGRLHQYGENVGERGLGYGVVGYDRPLTADELSQYTLLPDIPGKNQFDIVERFGMDPRKQTKPSPENWESMARLQEASAAAKPTPPPVAATSRNTAAVPSVPATGVQTAPASALAVDPARFQYKTGSSKNSGSTNSIADDVPYNARRAGVLDTWVDPKDGVRYVVNGHNRRAKALSSGDAPVRFEDLPAKDANQARLQGALMNIGDGRGTATDAARVFRDGSVTPEQLRADGISVTGKMASDGLALANLDPAIWRAVETSTMTESRGAAIGRALPGNGPQQLALVKMIDRAEKRGRTVTDATVAELGRMTSAAPVVDAGSGGGLFDDLDPVHESLALDVADLSSWARREIGADAAALKAGSNADRAARLNARGNVVNAGANAAAAREAAQTVEIYDRLSTMSGPVRDALNDAALAIKKGGKQTDVRPQLLERIRDAVQTTVSGGGQSIGVRSGRPATSPQTSGLDFARGTAGGSGPVGEGAAAATVRASGTAPARAAQPAREPISGTGEEAAAVAAQPVTPPTPLQAAETPVLPEEKTGRGRPKAPHTIAREEAQAAQEAEAKARGAADLARPLTPDERAEYDEFRRIDNRRERAQPLTKSQKARYKELAPKWEARHDAELSARPGMSAVTVPLASPRRASSAPPAAPVPQNAPARGPGGKFAPASPKPAPPPKPPRVAVAPLPLGDAPLPTQRDMVLDLSKGVGHVGTSKNLPRTTGGRYYPGTARTVIRFANDFDALGHEVAHKLDDKHGIVADWVNDPTSPFDSELIPHFSQHGSEPPSGLSAQDEQVYRRAEGVAEWINAHLVNPDEAKRLAPQFAAHFEATVPKADRDALTRFSDTIRRYYSTQQGAASARYRSATQYEPPKISAGVKGLVARAQQAGVIKPPHGEIAPYQTNFVTALRQRWRSDFAAILAAYNEAAIRRGINPDPLVFEAQGGVDPENQPELLARRLRYFNQKAEDILQNGMVNAAGERIGGPIGEIYEPLAGISQNPAQFEENLKDGLSLAQARRVIEEGKRLDARGQEILARAQDRETIRLFEASEKAYTGRMAQRIAQQAAAAKVRIEREAAVSVARQTAAIRADVNAKYRVREAMTEAEIRRAEKQADTEFLRRVRAMEKAEESKAARELEHAVALIRERTKRPVLQTEAAGGVIARQQVKQRTTVAGKRRAVARLAERVSKVRVESLTRGDTQAAQATLRTDDKLNRTLDKNTARLMQAGQDAAQTRGARAVATRAKLAQSKAAAAARAQTQTGQIAADTAARVPQKLAKVDARAQARLDAFVTRQEAAATKKSVERLARAADRISRVLDDKKMRLRGTGGGRLSDVDDANALIADLHAARTPEEMAALTIFGDRLQATADHVLQYNVETGRLSKDAYQRIKDARDFYTPLERLPDTGGAMGTGRAALGKSRAVARRFKGDTAMVESPSVVVLRNLVAGVKEADRNRVLRALRDMLAGDGRGMYQGQPVDLSDIGYREEPLKGRAGEVIPPKDSVPIYVGKDEPEYWIFPDAGFGRVSIASALANLGAIHTPPGFLAAPRFLRNMVQWTATHNPGFVVRNIIRDKVGRAINSRTAVAPLSPREIADNVALPTADEKELYSLFGAGLEKVKHLENATDFYEVQNRILKEMGLRKRSALDWVKKIGDILDTPMEVGERSTRVAEMRSASRLAQRAGLDEYNTKLLAADQAARLADFTEAGEWARWVNQNFVPFFSAAIEGNARTVEAARRNPGRFALRALLVTALPTLAVYAWNAQDKETQDEYKEFPSYVRDYFWLIKGGTNKWIAIPKPHEVGVASSIIERGLDYARAKNDTERDAALDGYGGSLWRAFAPAEPTDFMGGSLKAFWEVQANYSTFRDASIVPDYEKNLRVDLRPGAKEGSRLAQRIGDQTGQDARVVDFLLSSLAGEWGRSAAEVSDIGRSDRPRAVANLARRALGLVKETPGTNAASVQRVSKDMAEAGVPPSSAAVKRLSAARAQYRSAATDEQREDAARQLRAAANDPELAEATQAAAQRRSSAARLADRVRAAAAAAGATRQEIEQAVKDARKDAQKQARPHRPPKSGLSGLNGPRGLNGPSFRLP